MGIIPTDRSAEFSRENYTGPAYWIVTATSEHSWDLVDMSGRRVATYSSAERANKAREEFERAALREYLERGSAT